MSLAGIRLASGAGDPDDALPCRIDVVAAACALADYWTSGTPYDGFIDARYQADLCRAVAKYKRACAARFIKSMEVVK